MITTRFNGASEFLLPGQTAPGSPAGFVLDDPHNHRELAWLMSQLFDPGRRAAFALAARRTAAVWTFDHHYQQLLQVLTEAVAVKMAVA